MLGGLFHGLRVVLDIVFNMVQLLVIASVFMNWVNADPSNPMVQMVRQLTEPLFKPFRKLFGRWSGPIDFAPFVVLLILIFLHKSITYYLGTLVSPHGMG